MNGLLETEIRVFPPCLGPWASLDGGTFDTRIKRHEHQDVKEVRQLPHSYKNLRLGAIVHHPLKTHLLPGSNIYAILLLYAMNSVDISPHLVSSASEIHSLGNHSETKKFLQPLIL